MSYIGNQPTSVAFLTDQFSGTGSQTAFTMSVAPANTASVLVSISGVLQAPDTYSVNGLTLTFSAAPPSGTGNISVRYLGIPAAGVTTTAYRTVAEFTATAGQTSFTVPSYTVGFINVFRNGVRLGAADFTATNGTTVVLVSGATSGDLVTTESFYVSSVLNAIPAVDGAVSQSKLAAGVAGNGPTFSAYTSGTGATIGTGATKVTYDTEEWDTNNNFASSRFTPTVAGYYQINAQLQPNSSYTGGYIGVYKNGSVYKYGNYANLGISFGGFVVSTLVYCNGTTDYIEIYAAFTSSQASSNGSFFSYVNGFLARAA